MLSYLRSQRLTTAVPPRAHFLLSNWSPSIRARSLADSASFWTQLGFDFTFSPHPDLPLSPMLASGSNPWPFPLWASRQPRPLAPGQTGGPSRTSLAQTLLLLFRQSLASTLLGESVLSRKSLPPPLFRRNLLLSCTSPSQKSRLHPESTGGSTRVWRTTS